MATATKPAKPVTPKQREWIVKLMGEKRLDGVPWAPTLAAVMAEKPDDWHERYTSKRASQWLDVLFGLPGKPPAQSVTVDVVPAGKYKVGARLLQVDRPEGGQWDGWVFVKDITRGIERLKGQAADEALQEIAACGAENAAQEYGKATGECGVCSRRLTDPVSVALGIGPVCRTKF